jgi:hypothetical protein
VLKYGVVATTNFNGVAFPRRSIPKYLHPNFPARDREDLSVGTELEVSVTRITALSAGALAAQGVAVSALMAYDYRSTNGDCASNVVTNDQWQAASQIAPYNWQPRRH